jgi:hypothetical protein
LKAAIAGSYLSLVSQKIPTLILNLSPIFTSPITSHVKLAKPFLFGGFNPSEEKASSGQ